jgi:hypothetical protein
MVQDVPSHAGQVGGPGLAQSLKAAVGQHGVLAAAGDPTTGDYRQLLEDPGRWTRLR